ncbi:hypothetical protein D3C76_1693220 [compost metagenome]
MPLRAARAALSRFTAPPTALRTSWTVEFTIPPSRQSGFQIENSQVSYSNWRFVPCKGGRLALTGDAST